MRKLALPEEILLSIQQPARYIGGEVNMVKKDPSAVDVRFAMCFPDVYDIGMSHLGIQIPVSYTHLDVYKRQRMNRILLLHMVRCSFLKLPRRRSRKTVPRIGACSIRQHS